MGNWPFGGDTLWVFLLRGVLFLPLPPCWRRKHTFQVCGVFSLFLLWSFGPFVWIDVFQYLEPFSLLGGLLFFSSRLALQHRTRVLRYVSSKRTLLSFDVFHCLRLVFRRPKGDLLFLSLVRSFLVASSFLGRFARSTFSLTFGFCSLKVVSEFARRRFFART